MQTESTVIPAEKVFSNLKPLFNNKSSFVQNEGDFEVILQYLQECEILVVGAGGLGCQIVKNLAMSGIKNIYLIDMDTIDLTNLNRQFLFRQKDVGKYKADVVAQFVMKRCPGVKVIPKKNRIQQLPFSFYQKFPIIIGGLDNIQARKYLNNIAFALNLQSQETRCFYIDGATQGFEGQALLVQPFKSSCYQCSLFEGLGNKTKANYCTIANTPRTPQHCIQYVLQILWQKTYGKQTKRDNDNLEHMKWVYQKSLQRAKQFKIQGVTQMLTMGVAKNIIPAIASTNALIASVLTGQALKKLTGCGPTLNNYFLYYGGVNIGGVTMQSEKKLTCSACNMRENKLDTLNIKLSQQKTIKNVLQEIKKYHAYIQFSFITHNKKTLLNSCDQQRYQGQLNTKLSELIQKQRFKGLGQVQVLFLTDNSLKSQLRVQLTVLHVSQQKKQ